MEKGKGWAIRSFSISVEDLALLEKFREIAAREGATSSQLIVRLIREYVQGHELGNPQQRLDVICERGEAYRAPKLCLLHGS